MPTEAVTLDDLFAQLATLTSMNPDEWRDFVACTPAQQALIVQGYRDQDWVKSPDVLAKVLAVLGVIGTIAGTAAGVASAIGAIKSLVP